MAINRTIFTESFSIKDLPSWHCPTCKIGFLKNVDKNVKAFEDSTSLAARIGHDNWEIEWISGIFIGLLNCTNNKCKEKVAITGKMHVTEEQEYDHIDDRWNVTGIEILTPTNFNPPIDIFSINVNVPEKIKLEIINAFNIYWVDIFSCANKIRIVIELIMDDQGVPKMYIDRHKRKSFTLHKRIEKFSTTNSDLASHLMAIKWIGNSGSHHGTALTQEDVLDGFELLEYATTKLYDTSAERIKKLTKTINKKRRPIGKRKRK